MGGAAKFTDLVVWHKAHQLTLEVYQLTKKFLADERYGLISQMRRSAVSIPANIAEGFKKRSNKDKANYYNISQGSLEELKYYLILCRDLNYVNDSRKAESLCDETGKLLHAFIKSLNT